MPHTLAENPQADSLWLQFLTTHQIDREAKRDLLMAGLTPTALLQSEAYQVQSEAHQDSQIARLQRLLLSNPKHDFSGRLRFSATLLHLGEQAPLAGDDRRYPALLGELSDAPLALFVAGDLSCLNRPAIAVVGSRNPSRDGLRLAERVGHELAAAGFLVVSGLAAGVDAAAHRGALASGGQTLAVMATGLDRIYPACHGSLAQAIVQQGAIVTEFCPGVSPHRWHFPRRNRTLSGLCLATVVIEAGRPSGSLITATAAAEQGREVFAAPWSLFHKNGAGCLYLLSEGAHLLLTPAKLIEQMGGSLAGWAALSERPPASQLDAGGAGHLVLGFREKQLLRLLGDGDIDLATLVSESGLSVDDVLTTVTRLELGGYVAQTHAGFRVQRHE